MVCVTAAAGVCFVFCSCTVSVAGTVFCCQVALVKQILMSLFFNLVEQRID